MAIECPHCGRQYDVTLFEFGRHLRCSCGATVSLADPQRRQATRPSATRILLTCIDGATPPLTLTRLLGGRHFDAICCSDEPFALTFARHLNIVHNVLVQTNPCLRAQVSADAAPSSTQCRLRAAASPTCDELLDDLADRNAHKTTLVLAEPLVCRALLTSVLPRTDDIPSPRVADLFLLERRPVGWRRIA